MSKEIVKKPHILYWKWNDEMLDLELVRKKTYDIINRSMFDLIYVAMHSFSKENCILASDKVIDSIKECADILNKNGRKLVLDLNITKEVAYLDQFPLSEKAYMTRYMEGTLDTKGRLKVDVPESNGVLSAKCVDFDENGFFVEDTIEDITGCVSYSGETIIIDAGVKYANKSVLFFPIKKLQSHDICGDEYKEQRELLFRKLADVKLAGAATDEWGLVVKLEIDQQSQRRLGTNVNWVGELREEGMDISKIPFISRWFWVSDGMRKYYNKYYGRDLVDDLIWFRKSSSDTKKSEDIVNMYISTLRRRVVDGDVTFYDAVKKYFGREAYVLCHPTWWGDELDSNFDILRNGLDWWEVKRDFAQTDELILIPVRMAMARKCPDNLWYNMWYSMRTMDIKTYFKETWVNARYAGRTHHLGYECYEPGVVLTLYQEGRLEAISDMECEIEKLNHVQNSRPDSRVLVIFGYEAVSNWRISEPELDHWKRVAPLFHNVWEFTKELFDKHHLCEAVPSYEIDNGNVTVNNGKINYCGHDYDAAVVLYPIGISEKSKELIKEYANSNGVLTIAGDQRNELTDVHAMKLLELDADTVSKWLDKNGVLRNCGDNYCVYEDGSVVFTTDGKTNVDNELEVNCDINGHNIQFKGKDFLYMNLKENNIVYGKKERLIVDGKQI